MTIETFKKQYSSAQQNKASKLKARELDLEADGKYVAYVDDGNVSYDVSVQIQGNKVIHTSCDCGKNPCVHVLVVLNQLHFNKSKSKKSALPSSNKESKFRVFYDNLPTEQKLSWLYDFLESDKKIKLLFTNHFQYSDTLLTSEELDKQTNIYLKTIVRSKKNVTPDELKQLIVLLDSLYTPVIKNYIAKPMDITAIELLCAVLRNSYHISSTITTTSNKYSAFLNKKIIEPIVTSIATIVNIDDWRSISNLLYQQFKKHIFVDKKIGIAIIREKLKLESPERQVITIESLLELFGNDINDFSLHHIRNIIIDYCVDLNIAPSNLILMTPSRFENEFNVKLFNKLLELNQLNLVEEYCKSCIAQNYYEPNKTPYQIILKKIYIQQGKHSKAAEICLNLLHITLSIEDYDYVLEHLGNDKLLEKRTNHLISSLRDLSRKSFEPAEKLLWHIYQRKEMYNSMIHEIGLSEYYTMAVQFFDILFTHKRKSLLEVLLKKSNSNFSFFYASKTDYEKNAIDKIKADVDTLFEKVVASYTHEEIISAFYSIKKSSNYDKALFYEKILTAYLKKI